MLLNPQLKYVGWIAVVIAAVPAFELVRIFLDWLNERYIITNRRVIEVRGTINKHVRDSALEKVNDVDMKQSVVGRLLGYGTVQIITGSDIGVNMFRRISNPVRFKREMLNAKEELHHGNCSSKSTKIEVRRSNDHGEDGVMYMWLSDDTQRIPLRIDIDAPLGMLHAELRHTRPSSAYNNCSGGHHAVHQPAEKVQ